jgi:hypothetical protein
MEVALVAVAKILGVDLVDVGGAGVLNVNVSIISMRSKGSFVNFAPVLVDSFGWHWSCGLLLVWHYGGRGVCACTTSTVCDF